MAQALQIEFLVPGLINQSGEPAVGFTVEFFETDGVTPKTIWKAAEMIVANEAENPFTLKADGSAVLYGNGHYSIEIKNTLGVVVQTLEDFLFIDPSTNIQLFGIDASTFGSGDNADAIAQAILSASGADATVILKSQPWNIDQDLIIPSNIELLYLYGAFTTIQTGITLTISPGVVRAPLFNIFRGPGTLVLDSKINDRPSIWFSGGTDVDRLFTGMVTFTDDVLMEKNLTITGDLIVDDIIMDEITLNKINAIATNVEINAELTSTSDPLKIKTNTTFENTDLNMTFDGRVAGNNNVTNFTFKGAKSVLNDFFSCINFQNFDSTGTSTDITMGRICGFNDGIDKGGIDLETFDGSTLSRRIVIKNDGKVGIGTALSPAAFLDVQGDAKIGPDTPYENILLEPGTVFAPYNGSFKFQSFTVPGGGTDRFLTHFSDRTIGGTTLHDVSIDGNLGIGTTTPDFKFDVSGDMRIESGNRIRFGGTGAGDTEVSIGNNATNSLNVDGQLIVNTKIIANDSEITRPTIKIVSTVNVGTTVNAAIASFGTGGGIIYLPAETYSLNTSIFVNKPNITIMGDSRDSTIIDCDATLIGMIEITGAANNFEIKKLTLNGTGTQTADFCIRSTAFSNNVLIENNTFTGALDLFTLFVNTAFIKNNIFQQDIASNGIILEGNDIEISSNKFNDGTGSSTAIFINSTIRIYVFRNEFLSFSDGVVLNNSNILELNVYDNEFDDCNRVVFASGGVQANDLSFYKNKMTNGTDLAFQLNTGGNILIQDNKFIDQVNGIEIGIATGDVRIIDNIFLRVTANTDLIHFISSYSTASDFLSVIIENNTFTDITAERVIHIQSFLHTVLSNSSLSINNNTFLNVNLDDSGTGAACILFKGNLFKVNNNTFSDISSDGNLDIIQALDNSFLGSISNNKIFLITLPVGSFGFFGIKISASSNIDIDGNMIRINTNTAGDIIGISEVGICDFLNIRHNYLELIATGLGTGTSFSIATTRGVATSNQVSQSDVLGTLTISAGIVANNDT